MKTIKKAGIVLTMALVTILSSCGGSDDNGGGGSGSGGFVKAKVDGASFAASGQLVMGQIAEGNFSMQGVTTAGTSIAINVFAYDGTLETGVYNLSAASNNDNYTGSVSYNMVSGTTATVYNSLGCDTGIGSVEITFIDATKIEGKFSFNAKNTETCQGAAKNVTAGTFRCLLTAN